MARYNWNGVGGAHISESHGKTISGYDSRSASRLSVHGDRSLRRWHLGRGHGSSVHFARAREPVGLRRERSQHGQRRLRVEASTWCRTLSPRRPGNSGHRLLHEGHQHSIPEDSRGTRHLENHRALRRQLRGLCIRYDRVSRHTRFARALEAVAHEEQRPRRARTGANAGESIRSSTSVRRSHEGVRHRAGSESGRQPGRPRHGLRSQRPVLVESGAQATTGC